SRVNGVVYDPGSQVLITDGATQGVAVALAALLEPGDEVLLPDPVYDAYASPITLWSGRPVPVPSTLNGGRFRLDRESLERAVTPRCRCLLLNTPWNPVGTVFGREELVSIMTFAAEHDLFIVSDEIYESFVYDGRHHVSPAALSEDA